MRRLPVYFLVDVSESMVGEPIQQVQDGMRMIVQELRTDPYALETAFISVIAFAGKAKTLQPLTELYKFYPPIFPIGGGTSLGAALDYLMDDMDKSLVKTTTEQREIGNLSYSSFPTELLLMARPLPLPDGTTSIAAKLISLLSLSVIMSTRRCLDRFPTTFFVLTAQMRCRSRHFQVGNCIH